MKYRLGFPRFILCLAWLYRNVNTAVVEQMAIHPANQRASYISPRADGFVSALLIGGTAADDTDRHLAEERLKLSDDRRSELARATLKVNGTIWAKFAPLEQFSIIVTVNYIGINVSWGKLNSDGRFFCLFIPVSQFRLTCLIFGSLWSGYVCNRCLVMLPCQCWVFNNFCIHAGKASTAPAFPINLERTK